MGRKKKPRTVRYTVRVGEEVLEQAREKHPKLHAEIVEFINNKAKS